MIFGERRIHVRKDCTLFIDFNDSKRTQKGHLRNICKGGAFIETQIQRRYRVGQRLSVTIPYMLKAKKIMVNARIVRIIQPNGIAIEFLNTIRSASAA